VLRAGIRGNNALPWRDCADASLVRRRPEPVSGIDEADDAKWNRLIAAYDRVLEAAQREFA
jgi:hypothetical protein